MKKIFTLLLAASILCSLASCGNESNESDESGASSGSSADVSSVNESSENNEGSSSDDVSSDGDDLSGDNGDFTVNINKVEAFPKDKMSHSVIDNGNYYLKVQTVTADQFVTEENALIREFAVKGKDVYSTVKQGDEYQWYYSNGNATFVFDDENKTYSVESVNPLKLVLFSSIVVSEEEMTFFGVESKAVKYDLGDNYFIIHFYRKTDGSWLGFQYMYGDKYEEANIVLAASDDYPDYAVFSIPEDYDYYFHSGDNEASMDWN